MLPQVHQNCHRPHLEIPNILALFLTDLPTFSLDPDGVPAQVGKKHLLPG